MASYGQMSAELQLQAMAKLLAADVGTLLNQAHREEVEDWPWSFLLTSVALYPAAPQSAGTVTVTQGSPLVGGVGTAFAALPNSQSIFHVGTANVGVPISSVQSSTILTLAQPWMGATLAGAFYNIVTPVYSLLRFQEIYGVRQIVPLENVSREYLNRIDPARLATGGNPSLCWADAGWDGAGNPQIELWEPPSAVLPYVVEGKLGATTMVNSSDLPQVPSSVITAKTMAKAADALFANNGDNRYFQLASRYWEIYKDALGKARDADVRRQTQHQMKSRQPTPGLDVLATHDLFSVRG